MTRWTSTGMTGTAASFVLNFSTFTLLPPLAAVVAVVAQSQQGRGGKQFQAGTQFIERPLGSAYLRPPHGARFCARLTGPLSSLQLRGNHFREWSGAKVDLLWLPVDPSRQVKQFASATVQVHVSHLASCATPTIPEVTSARKLSGHLQTPYRHRFRWSAWSLLLFPIWKAECHTEQRPQHCSGAENCAGSSRGAKNHWMQSALLQGSRSPE